MQVTLNFLLQIVYNKLQFCVCIVCCVKGLFLLVCWELDLISGEVISSAYWYGENRKSVLQHCVHVCESFGCITVIID